LSPQNRVTTEALVKVLQYARGRPWWAAFYQALPVINDMRMKSGAIGGARSYAGYQRSRDGREFVYSIIVNNYDGSAAAVVKKMFAVLDVLK
jgi:D-alanyl-D-alanine carboxypeptidase/D-alanyl-D-alanine-endopeptidase (penicillin-binding protein 4)